VRCVRVTCSHMATSLSTGSCWRVAADEGSRVVMKGRLARDDRVEAGRAILATRVPLTPLIGKLAE
jgi:hypothetical protein